MEEVKVVRIVWFIDVCQIAVVVIVTNEILHIISKSRQYPLDLYA